MRRSGSTSMYCSLLLALSSQLYLTEYKTDPILLQPILLLSLPFSSVSNIFASVQFSSMIQKILFLLDTKTLLYRRGMWNF